MQRARRLPARPGGSGEYEGVGGEDERAARRREMSLEAVTQAALLRELLLLRVCVSECD
jgi:hypothetical protein